MSLKVTVDKTIQSTKITFPCLMIASNSDHNTTQIILVTGVNPNNENYLIGTELNGIYIGHHANEFRRDIFTLFTGKITLSN